MSIFQSKSESDIRFMCEVYVPKLSDDELKILAKHLRELLWLTGSNRAVIEEGGPYMFNKSVVDIDLNDATTDYRFSIPQLLYDELHEAWKL